MASAAKQDERLNHDDGVPQAPDQLTTDPDPAQAESSAAETITTSAEQNIAPAEASAPYDAAQVKPETEAQTEAEQLRLSTRLSQRLRLRLRRSPRLSRIVKPLMTASTTRLS